MVLSKGPSINIVSSKEAGGGVKNIGICLIKRRQRWGHKVGKKGPTSFMDAPFIFTNVKVLS